MSRGFGNASAGPSRLTITNSFHLCRVEGIPYDHASNYPFKNGDHVLMLGKIAQMPGHVVIAMKDGRVLFGYHADWFRRLTEDEV